MLEVIKEEDIDEANETERADDAEPVKNKDEKTRDDLTDNDGVLKIPKSKGKK